MDFRLIEDGGGGKRGVVAAGIVRVIRVCHGIHGVRLEDRTAHCGLRYLQQYYAKIKVIIS